MTEGFLFVRHGQTQDNQLGLRCGGDRDVPLTERGIVDARAAAMRLRASGRRCGLVIAGPLRRTAVTGALFAEALRVPLQEREWLRERTLGAWNGLPVEETRPWFAQGLTPPGGESEAAFTARVLAGVAVLADVLARRPLLVGSKGIGRVLLHRLAGLPGVELGNCEIVAFERIAGGVGDALPPDHWRWRCVREADLTEQRLSRA
ncbi:MAG TPA: histidine phosphatase family protein [Azospirillum sp.]|nr:histidine phosphatase family protein [Azospirillum sp.]